MFGTTTSRFLLTGFTLLVGALPAAAQPAPAMRSTQPGQVQFRPATPAPATANPTDAQVGFEAARVAWEAMPLADRLAVQEGLIWAGDYTGSIDGTFGRMSFEALTAFQVRRKLPPDGLVTPALRAALDEGAAKRREATGWQMTNDPATGVRIGIPSKLVVSARPIEGGSRWTSKDGRLDIRTFALPGQDLGQLFERMKQETPGRKVTYSVLRTDWFVISDTGAGRDSYARFVRVNDGVRGFVFIRDPALGPDVARLVIALAGTFEPVAGAKPATASEPPSAPPSTPSTQAATPPTQPSTPVPTGLAATGLMVAPGRVLTAKLGSCTAPTVSGKPAKLESAIGGELALLAVEGGGAATEPLILPDTAAAAGTTAVVISAGPGLGATTGALTEHGLRAPLQRGGLGAIALDASGRLVGIVTDKPNETRQIMGLIPEATYAVAGGDALASAIASAGGKAERKTAGPAMPSGAVVASISGRVVAVACGK